MNEKYKNMTTEELSKCATDEYNEQVDLKIHYAHEANFYQGELTNEKKKTQRLRIELMSLFNVVSSTSRKDVLKIALDQAKQALKETNDG